MQGAAFSLVQKDFSRYERCSKWLPFLLGVFATVGSLAVVLFFMNLKKRGIIQGPNTCTHSQDQSNYVEEMCLPRVYDQPKIDDRSPVYCDVIESEEGKTPNIYTECV